MITVAPGMLEHSFEHLRRCGDARRECIVVWTGPCGRVDYVDEVVHPVHRASAVHCEVDPDWVGRFWLDLARRQRTARAQVHTHPGSAFHSDRDDAYPLIHTAGYVSLVVPKFATGPASLADVFAAVRRDGGGWEYCDPRATVRIGNVS